MTKSLRIFVIAVLVSLGINSRADDHASSTGSLQQIPQSYYRGEPLRIGNQPQFVFDDYIVEDRWKLTRKTGTVIKYGRNPVVVQDKPWEEAVGGSPSVLYDAKLKKYHMWYSCFSLANYFSKKGPAYYIGYAESEDAYNWTKPKLQGFPFAGHDATNIIATGNNKRASGAQVMFNPDQSDPKRRFMILYSGGNGFALTYSPDGIHWEPNETRLLYYHSDFPNHVVWVPETKLWHMYVRSPIRPGGMGPLPEGVRHTGRRVAMMMSPDITRWGMPRTVMYPDERDIPDFDGAHIFRRHGAFLSLYAVMNSDKGKSENETYIATSRDGVNWERMWDRQPLVPRGGPGAYDHGQVEPGMSGPIEMGPDMLFYYYASPLPQNAWFNETSVGIFRMRKDRFIGQEAGEQTAFLVTRQFLLEGSKLQLNLSSLPPAYDDHSGGIWVEIIQAPDFKTKETTWETPVAGFSMKDADRVAGDAFDQTVTWNGRSDLSALSGKAVYLRLKMKRATLYSFQVVR
ncbi:MAG: hypothetical protein NTY38_11585 [Acidobacteria bacterium]|nr:hypothetical protein [Acidobacteriota bacterium]